MEPSRIEMPDAEQGLGVTRVLTDQGWEESEYLDPEDDWLLLDDGSWSSPDGRYRSWLAFAPDPSADTD